MGESVRRILVVSTNVFKSMTGTISGGEGPTMCPFPRLCFTVAETKGVNGDYLLTATSRTLGRLVGQSLPVERLRQERSYNCSPSRINQHGEKIPNEKGISPDVHLRTSERSLLTCLRGSVQIFPRFLFCGLGRTPQSTETGCTPAFVL